MTDARCEAFLDEPERFPEHVEDCSACRNLLGDLDRLDREIASGQIPVDGAAAETVVDSLPLAAWEGARFRSWPVAIASAFAILVAAAAVFAVLGISPITGVIGSISGPLVRSAGWVEASRHVAGILKGAPFAFHATVAIAFVAVNAAFIYLLRRAPKGIDVSSR